MAVKESGLKPELKSVRNPARNESSTSVASFAGGEVCCTFLLFWSAPGVPPAANHCNAFRYNGCIISKTGIRSWIEIKRVYFTKFTSAAAALQLLWKTGWLLAVAVCLLFLYGTSVQHLLLSQNISSSIFFPFLVVRCPFSIKVA